MIQNKTSKSEKLKVSKGTHKKKKLPVINSEKREKKLRLDIKGFGELCNKIRHLKKDSKPLNELFGLPL